MLVGIAFAFAGDVVALGDGRTMDGDIKPFYLKEGNTVGSERRALQALFDLVVPLPMPLC